uniref:Cytochrome b561 domain-containing protein n=1 Tax=Leersia perrieri TaxID=77586 RepID=A0A0D9WSN5_9ORYZ
MAPLPLLAIALLLCLSVAAAACGTNTSLAGYESDLRMSQHQLRGRVEVLDGCSFRVTGLDLLAGSPSARWWRADGAGLDALARGAPAAADPLNRTFLSESLVFRLLPGVTWPLVPLLAAFDPLSSSLFGFVLLNNTNSDEINSTAPTMFDSCKQLSPRMRVRWTVDAAANSIDVGVEAAVGSEYYIAFGWSSPAATNQSMAGADIAVTGFTEDGLPFADDYFITNYTDCTSLSSSSSAAAADGVCPDTIFAPGAGDDSGEKVNNTRLVYGHRRDGVSFVRFRRPLISPDKAYDVAVNATSANTTVIWSIGLLRPPDSLQPYYLPLITGSSSGFATLNLTPSPSTSQCVGPIDADDKEDQERITAERNTPLVVTVGQSLHYPNPPNPSEVFYINKKEAPVLKVERGVPVTFSVEAGHGAPLYITSDAIGGNATARNGTEVVYAGGERAEGVAAAPAELVWMPDRNTPDVVYYQSLYEPKMGWKIHVVDGGLSDMYNNSVLLDDQQRKSGYLAVAFGSAMVNSYAYVGWIDGNGTGHVTSYWIDGKDGASIHETSENLTHTRCRSENGEIVFEFTRPLSPSSCSGRIECMNIIDPTTPLKVIWAMGSQWSSGRLDVKNMHSITSSRAVRILLLAGTAEAEEDLRPVLAVHGFMMFVSWGLLLPGGVMAARYLKHMKGDIWFQAHSYLQCSGMVVMFLGFLFAIAELRGFSFKSTHAKIGILGVLLAFLQPINAYLRPHLGEKGEILSRNRVIWEYLHVFTGRSALVVGAIALFTGLQHLGHRYGSKNIKGLTCGLILWAVGVSLVVVYLEFMAVKRRRDVGTDGLSGKWVLGNTDEDDSVDLLQSSKMEPDSIEPMEVQLEPLKG